MPSLKIALVVPGGVGSGYYGDGIPLLLNFCEEIGKLCDLHVFSLTRTNEDFQAPNYQLHSIETEHYHSLLKKYRLFIKNFAEVHAKENFQLVQGIWTAPSGFMAVRAAKKFGLKSLLSLQGGGLADIKSIGYGGNQGFLKKRLNKWVCQQADWISAETNFQADLLLDKKYHRKLNVIHYGIRTEDFKNPVQELINRPIEFIHVANINVVKNQEFLIELFDEVRKRVACKLKIIGPDFYEGKIQRLVEQRNLNDLVSFEGHQPFKVVKEELRKAHVLLHTSHYESTAMAVVEAMASKVLVCATNVGIVSDLGSDFFHIFGTKDVNECAEEIVHLLPKRTLVEAKVKRAYGWTQQNSLSKTAGKFNSVYKKILTS